MPMSQVGLVSGAGDYLRKISQVADLYNTLANRSTIPVCGLLAATLTGQGKISL